MKMINTGNQYDITVLNNITQNIRNITVEVSLNTQLLKSEKIYSKEFSGEYEEIPASLTMNTVVRRYNIEEIYFAVTTTIKRIRTTTISFLKFWAKNPGVKCLLLFQQDDLMNNRNITEFLAHEGIPCKVLSSNEKIYEERYVELFQNAWKNQDTGDMNTERKQIQWFAIGDDDTIWFINNLLHTLQHYNSTNLIYLGDISDRKRQNKRHGEFFAYGGGGTILSRPLTSLFAQHTETCKQIKGNFGADGMIGKCLVNVMNVSLTRNTNFHQNDLAGDLTGLMESGIDGLVSLHHMFSVWKPFPDVHSNRINETIYLLTLAYKTFDRFFLKRYMHINYKTNQTLVLTMGYSFSLFNRILSFEELAQVEDTGCCIEIVGRKIRRKEINKKTWFFRHLTTENCNGSITFNMIYENKSDSLIPIVSINVTFIH